MPRATRPAWRCRDARGAAVVDLVLVLVVLLPLVTAVLQVGLTLYVRNVLASAASEGARHAAVLGNGPAEGRAEARDQITGALSGRYAEGISARPRVLGGAPAVEVRIEATVPVLGLGGPGVSFTVSGSAVRELP